MRSRDMSGISSANARSVRTPICFSRKYPWWLVSAGGIRYLWAMPRPLSSAVILAPHVRAALLSEARAAGDRECCGLLLGEKPGHILDIRPAANIAANPVRHFEIDPVTLIAAERDMRHGTACLMGYYHSHPVGEAVPSRTDAAASAGDGRIWAIVAKGDIRLWRNAAGGDVHSMFCEIAYICG